MQIRLVYESKQALFKSVNHIGLRVQAILVYGYKSYWFMGVN